MRGRDAGAMYLRFAALGDSTTYGIGDVGPGGSQVWRGWARLLADAMGTTHDVSFYNLAAPGATSLTVRYGQLDPALAHKPDLASLIVGVNDTMRSTWDVRRIRRNLLETAAALHDGGATLLTVRFHDHGAVFGLPGVLRRPLWGRIEAVNEVYDEIHERFDTVRIDLADRPEVSTREFWSVDRLHPSELGHRALAHHYAELLNERGFRIELPSLERDGGYEPDLLSDLKWMVLEGAPWVGRRARDLGPWAARLAVSRRTPAAAAVAREPQAHLTDEARSADTLSA
jgi:lysophospholipase L1-like esterase